MDEQRLRYLAEGWTRGEKREDAVNESEMGWLGLDALAEIERLRDALSELADLMDDVVAGTYMADSFTTQPARAALTPSTSTATEKTEDHHDRATEPAAVKLCPRCGHWADLDYDEDEPVAWTCLTCGHRIVEKAAAEQAGAEAEAGEGDDKT